MTALLAVIEWLLTVVLPTLIVIGFLRYAYEVHGDAALRRLADGIGFVLIVAILLKAGLAARDLLPADGPLRLPLQIGLPLFLGLLGMGVERIVKAVSIRLAKAQVSP